MSNLKTAFLGGWNGAADRAGLRKYELRRECGIARVETLPLENTVRFQRGPAIPWALREATSTKFRS